MKLIFSDVTEMLKLLALFLVTVTFAFAQTPKKVVEWSKSPIGSNNEIVSENLKLFRQIDGVEIEGVMVDNKPITLGEHFVATDDWLKSLVFRVKNISSQKLLSVQLTMILPQLGPGSPDVVFCYGCAPEEKERGFLPGEVVEMKILGGPFYDWVRSRIEEKIKLSETAKAEIHHLYVKPPNGPTWFSGCIKTANPKNACPTLP